jgi:hypothetical protein
MTSRDKINKLTTDMLQDRNMDISDILANMLGIMSSSYQEASDRHALILQEIKEIKAENAKFLLLQKEILDLQKKTDKLSTVQTYHTFVISILAVIGSITLYYLVNFGLQRVFEPNIITRPQVEITEKL